MAEISGFWTTGGATGDQQASYTQAQLAVAHRIMAGCAYFEGIAPSFLTELAVSATGLNEVTVGAGGAMVDGLWYYNDSDQTVAIPSASGGGNTRIDRIVLRADWASFTVRVHRIAGVDAASPTAPAITQTPGTTYDIKLAQVLVDTAGNCTVTGEKLFAAAPVDGVTLEEYNGSLRVKAGGIATGNIANDAVTTAKIADGNVTTAKIANDAIDDTKAGNRVPQFYRRQGSDATNWTWAGPTNYTPGAVRMQAGALLSSVSSEVTVTFPVAFSAPPLVYAQVVDMFLGGQTSQIAAVDIRNVTANGFSFAVYLAQTPAVRVARVANWFAVGPE